MDVGGEIVEVGDDDEAGHFLPAGGAGWFNGRAVGPQFAFFPRQRQQFIETRRACRSRGARRPLARQRRVGLVFAICCGHIWENEPPPEYDHVRLGLGGIGAICGIGVFAGPADIGLGF